MDENLELQKAELVKEIAILKAEQECLHKILPILRRRYEDSYNEYLEMIHPHSDKCDIQIEPIAYAMRCKPSNQFVDDGTQGVTCEVTKIQIIDKINEIINYINNTQEENNEENPPVIKIPEEIHLLDHDDKYSKRFKEWIHNIVFKQEMGYLY